MVSISMDIVELKNYHDIEVEYSKALSQSVKEIKNPIIKTIIEAISQDSFKHAMIYKAIMAIASGEGPLLSEEEAEKIRDEVEKHIKSEEEMIRQVKALLDKGVDNKAIKFLLEAILKDEITHHSMLRRVHEIIVKRHTLTESDLWDMIWRDVAFHGTPGG